MPHQIQKTIYAKLGSIVSDPSKFISVNVEDNKHPIITRKQSIKYLLRKYLKSYDDEVIRNLLPSGLISQKSYGLIKVHKKIAMRAQLSL